MFGSRSMDTVRRPLCGCFVLSCMVGGIFRKPLGFRRCLPHARPEKAKPFQAGRSPCTKHPQDCPALPLRTEKKFLRVPRGVFSKMTLGRVWDSVPQRESEPIWPGAPFQAGRSPCTKHPRLSSFAFTPRKKFLRVPRGVFSKTLPWQGVGQHPTKGERASHRGTPFQAGQSPFTKHPQTVRLCLYKPKKVFEGSKGRFFKNAPLAGSGTASHKDGRSFFCQKRREGGLTVGRFSFIMVSVRMYSERNGRNEDRNYRRRSRRADGGVYSLRSWGATGAF